MFFAWNLNVSLKLTLCTLFRLVSSLNLVAVYLNRQPRIYFFKGNKMSLDQRAQILTATNSATYGVRDLAQTLKWKTANVISLLKKMNQEQLVEFQQAPHSKRGRPKKRIACTPLGFEFLATYNKLKMTPLKARKEDLAHAVKDAAYASRLVANGHAPFQIFMELNMIARNITVSSETCEPV